MKKNTDFRRGFTLIELIFCIAIISILILSLSSAINYNLSVNMKLNAERYAWALADSVLQSNQIAAQKFENNNIEYTVTVKLENKKLDEIIKITSATIELPDIEIPLKCVDVKWQIGNIPYSITTDRAEF